MKNWIFALFLLAPAAWAGHSDHHIFLCVVNNFDRKIVNGNCNPSKPNVTMNIPREWIQEKNLKADKVVKFVLDNAQFDKWMAMNQPAKRGK
jgi:hypothetical protein